MEPDVTNESVGNSHEIQTLLDRLEAAESRSDRYRKALEKVENQFYCANIEIPHEDFCSGCIAREVLKVDKNK